MLPRRPGCGGAEVTFMRHGGLPGPRRCAAAVPGGAPPEAAAPIQGTVRRARRTLYLPEPSSLVDGGHGVQVVTTRLGVQRLPGRPTPSR